jgi:hypothetical protein
MMRARMVTEDPQVGASLNSLRLNFVTPLATRILGEISPTIVEQLGAETPLSLFIKPIGQSRSFDDILVRAPVGMALTFDQVRIGRENQWENGDIEALAPEALQIVPTSTDSLWLRLNEPVTQNSANLIEVQFTSALYTPGGAFQASLGNSETENSWQRVDAEDATELQPGQGLILLGNVSDQRVLNAVETRPPIITPNGDRINDEMTLAFTVSNLSGQQQVDVRIFDLAGRMVRQIVEERPQVSGQYEMLWSGDGQDGHLLPPGIYLLRVEVNTDASSQVSNVVAQRVIQVVY